MSTEMTIGLTEKHTEIQRIAQDLFGKGPDWVTFYREIFGLHGIVRHTFPTRELLNDFEQSDAYREIQHMLTQLRAKRPVKTSTRRRTHPGNYRSHSQKPAREPSRSRPTTTAPA